MKTLILLIAIAFTASADAKPFHRKAPAPASKLVQEPPLPEPVDTAPAALPESGNFTVAPDGSVTRSAQKDAELKDWIIGIQNHAEKAEASEKIVKSQLGVANSRADGLQSEVDKVTADRNAQAALKDAALTKADYWHQKHGEALAKLWWWRLWGGAAIIIGILLIVGGLLIRYTAWGAKTLGPLVTKSLIV